MAHELPLLPYAHDALEPYIDERTMQIHHGKHHQAYITNLNNAIEGHDDLDSMSVNELIADLAAVPEAIRTAVRNNGGGHSNHSLFWTLMSPDGGGKPSGALAEAINGAFGDFESFQQQFGAAAAGRFGSGWAWLSVKDGALQLGSTANQDSPVMEAQIPILGLDVWEHAYYLRYQNLRPKYVENWWNVVNWEEVGRLYAAAV